MKTRLLTLLASLVSLSAFSQADLRVTWVSPGTYLRPGTYTFVPGIENPGSKGSAIRVWWQIDNGPVQDALPTMPTAMLASAPTLRFESSAFKFTVTAGTHKLKIWTTLITPGVTEANPKNDTLIQTLKVMPDLPDKHVILEVYKHQSCGPCYPAAEYNHDVVEPMKNHSIVNLYTVPADVLYNADAELINDVYQFAHPAPMFDRFRFKYLHDIMTGYSTTNNVYELKELGRRELHYEPLAVDIAAMSMDTVARLLKVKLRARTYDTMSGDIRFNLWITEDSIKAFQASAPAPNNYWHSHVLRSFVGGAWGKQGSLPARLAANQTYTYDFQYSIPAGYKLRHLKALGVVQVYHKDSMARRIINSVEVQAMNKLGIVTRNLIEDVALFPVPARQELQVRINPAISLSGARIYIRTLEGQLVRETPVGGHESRIPLEGLPAGNYLWQLQTPDGEATKPFTKLD